MAGPRSIFKNLNLYFEGNSYAGSILDFNPPKLNLKTEDVRAGGMDGSIKLTMGLDSLDTDFSVIDFNPALLSSISGAENNVKSFIARAALEDWDGTITAREIIMRGKVTSIDEGTLTPGTKAQLKITMNLVYYADRIGGDLVNEIDIINMVWMQNGVNTLAAIKNAIGI